MTSLNPLRNINALPIEQALALFHILHMRNNEPNLSLRKDTIHFLKANKILQTFARGCLNSNISYQSYCKLPNSDLRESEQESIKVLIYQLLPCLKKTKQVREEVILSDFFIELNQV